MRTVVKEFNGDYVAVQFFPSTDQDKNILKAFRNNNEDVQLTVIRWVEDALVNEASGQYKVVNFHDIQNNVYYIFKVQRVGSLGSY